MEYLLALDAGTTGNRAIVFTKNGEVVSLAQKELKQYFPEPGYVEQDPNEIWSTQLGVAVEALAKANLKAEDISALGITNQRETVILWNKETGEPVYNAIVWQCRRTAGLCDDLRKRGYEKIIYEKTGLILDPYFSGTKIAWILNHSREAAELAKEGKLLFGTVDTWLLWKLTGGKVHATDVSNASRTMLFNINTMCWDKELLEILGIPPSILPEVKPSSYEFGKTSSEFFGGEILIGGIAGDQQSALFGQSCFNTGEAKNTYGTGAFLLMNVGNDSKIRGKGLVTTVAWQIKDKVTYALEGSIFVAGSAVQWLRDEMRLIDSSEDSEYMAGKVEDTEGCYVVPAFTGLGAPYWDPYARGTITGITRGVNKYHIIRATLESMAYLSYDVLRTMEDGGNTVLRELKVDGGASANNFLMQFQSDILNRPVIRPKQIESTALGAAYLAGLTAGVYGSLEDIRKNHGTDRVFQPNMSEDDRKAKLKGWHKAVEYSKGWARE